MIILAKTIKGQEFLYDYTSARQVSKKSADIICKIVNEHKSVLGLKENEIFYKYEIDQYDLAYIFALDQKFTIRKGIVTARNY